MTDTIETPNAPSDNATPDPATDTPQATPDNVDNPSKQTETPTTLFPDNWQELMANDDKEKTILSRYASPKEVAKALLQANKKISEGFKLKIPNEKSTETEVKNYRQLMGVPDTHKDYQIKLSEGRTISEDDSVIVDSFLEKMHKTNASPAVVQQALDTYYEIQEQQEQQWKEINDQHAQQLEDELRVEYGSNYRGNINTAKTFMEKTFGKEASEVLEKAVGHDGKMLMNNPDILRAFVNLGLSDNPRATMPSGLSSVDSVEARITEIKSKMGTPEYLNNPKLQAEYRQLLEFSEKNKV